LKSDHARGRDQPPAIQQPAPPPKQRSRSEERIEAENRRLKDSLTEAEAKLEAITSIERSIREQ
jgi:hypothetical protein